MAGAALARVRDRDATVRAWAYLDPLQVARAARAADATPRDGRLLGIPIGVKDVILTVDMPTGYNTPLPDTGGPAADAACVAILREAGALVFGKTETVEFGATGRPAPTRNPHDLGRTPGGSSSGSAAAVADFHVPLALGTQTGGSIVRPASFCGVFGFKPTWGLVSCKGARRFAPSLDTIGWFARSPEDLLLLLDIFDPPPAPPPPLPGLRIAVCRTPLWAHATEATRDAMGRAEARFREAGAIVTALELPSAFAGLHDAHRVIMHAEGGRSFLAEHRLHGGALHPALRGMVQDLRTLDTDILRHAYDLAARCREAFDDLASGFTAVLAPSTPGVAPPITSGTGDYVFNGLWTLLHTPCVNLPLHTTQAGLPVGVTLTGPRFSDRNILAAAAALSA